MTPPITFVQRRQLVRIFVFGILLIFQTHGLFGGPAEDIQVRTLSFETAMEGLFCRVGKEYVPAALEPFSPGEYFSLGSERRLEFFRQLPSNQPGAEPLWQPVAQVSLPNSSTKFTVICLPVEGNQEPGREFEALVLDDLDPAYGAGAVRFLNLSPKMVAGKLGTSEFQIAPGKSEIRRSGLDAKGRTFLELFANHGGGWKVFSRGPVSLTRDRRATVIAAYSATLAAALQIDDNLLPNGKPKPEMLIAMWRDSAPENVSRSPSRQPSERGTPPGAGAQTKP